MNRRTAFRLAILSILLLAFFTSASAQIKDVLSPSDLGALKSDLRSSTKVPDVGYSVPLDAPINPVDYTVGPGDLLSLNIWANHPVDFQLTVTPEGTLLIPTVGPVDVRGISLYETKDRVIRLAEKKYLNAKISLTLVSPRKVSVSIYGYVLNEGNKDVSAVLRVGNVIAMSNAIVPDRMSLEEYAAAILKLRNEASERHIVLRRRSGDVLRVDLSKYRVTGESKYNPYLQEGDVIYVPGRTDLENSIGVFGGTMTNASFEYVVGDSLTDLIAMALGWRQNTNPERALLTRLSPHAARLDTLFVNPHAIMSGVDSNVALRPGDRLVLATPPDPRKNYRVTVNGEVKVPGVYPISLEGTKLSNIIGLAGGLLGSANLKGASLTRIDEVPESKIDKAEKERLSSKRSVLDAEDTSYYAVETALRMRGELVTVDFYRLFVERDSTFDVILKPYDIVDVPAFSHTVYVFGQVISPGHVTYHEGRNVQYYVESAKGFTEEARTGDVKIIKRGTRAWLSPDETKIEDGDFVWVPRELHHPFSYYLTTYSQVAGIVTAAATIFLLIRSSK